MTIEIIPIAGTEIRFMPGAWPMPEALRDEIPAAWARVMAAHPQSWDGRILGFTQPVVGADGIMRCEAYEDAFSTFLTWRDAGFPDIGMTHMFGTALIHTADNALIFGVMGPQTVNAGRIYPPGGSLEPRDVREGLVDAEACIALELDEETGLDAADARLGPLLAVFHGPRVAISRVFHFERSADDLLATIRANLERQEHRELADVVALKNATEGHAAGDLVDYAAAVLDALEAGRLFG